MFFLSFVLFIFRLIIINLIFLGKFSLIRYAYLGKTLFLLAILLNQIFFSPLPHLQKTEPVFNPSPLIGQVKLNSEQMILILSGVEDLNSLRLKQEAQLKLQTSHRDILFNLGIIALQQNQLDQAQEWFKKSHYQDPNNQLFKDNKFLLSTNF